MPSTLPIWTPEILAGPVIQTIAFAIVIAAAAWLAFVGLVCAVRPKFALAQLGKMGSNWPIQIGEHGLRGLAGAALILRADHTKAPEIFTVAGWFVLLTSIAILILPRHWHHGYAQWWAGHLPAGLVRWMAAPSLLAAGLVIYAAV